jgi:hypothetical protein
MAQLYKQGRMHFLFYRKENKLQEILEIKGGSSSGCIEIITEGHQYGF